MFNRSNAEEANCLVQRFSGTSTRILSGLAIPMGEGVDHGPDIAEGIQNRTGAAMVDVMTHPLTSFCGSATGGQHLNDFVGNQTACGLDLLMCGRPGQHFTDRVQKGLGNS